MATPSDLVKDYINARISHVPMPKNTQQEGERYNAENEDGNNDEYLRRKREEEDLSRETFEKNAREAERIIEANSQRELDDLDNDLDESASDYDDNHLEDDEFSGNYFVAQPDDESEKESLGDRIRARYDSLRASASDTAESLSSTFGASFGAAAGAASRFKRGDPIFSVQSPVRRGKSPSRYISRPGRSISRPYVGGRFSDSFSLGTNAGYNPYYPVNEGRQSFSSDEPRDLYLPSGANNPYEGEFSGRKAFKREFSDERERYDPFGYGGLSGDGFDNTSGFGSSLMAFGGDNSIFGGSAGNDNVFGNFGSGKTGKMDILGDSGMFAIGGDLVSPPASRKTTTKRKSPSTRKTAKKATKKQLTKRKASVRKRPHNGFVLP